MFIVELLKIWSEDKRTDKQTSKETYRKHPWTDEHYEQTCSRSPGSMKFWAHTRAPRFGQLLRKENLPETHSKEALWKPASLALQIGGWVVMSFPVYLFTIYLQGSIECRTERGYRGPSPPLFPDLVSQLNPGLCLSDCSLHHAKHRKVK